MGTDETITATGIEKEFGMSAGSGRKWVRRMGLEPIGRDLDTGAFLYRTAEVLAKREHQPGSGNRTRGADRRGGRRCTLDRRR